MKNRPITSKEVQDMNPGFLVTGQFPNRKQRRVIKQAHIMGQNGIILLPNSTKMSPHSSTIATVVRKNKYGRKH